MKTLVYSTSKITLVDYKLEILGQNNIKSKPSNKSTDTRRQYFGLKSRKDL